MTNIGADVILASPSMYPDLQVVAKQRHQASIKGKDVTDIGVENVLASPAMYPDLQFIAKQRQKDSATNAQLLHLMFKKFKWKSVRHSLHPFHLCS